LNNAIDITKLNEMKIKKFEFEIGAYFNSNYSLQYKKGLFMYRANLMGMRPTILIQLPPKNWDFSEAVNNEIPHFDSTEEDFVIAEEKLIQFVKYASRYCRSWKRDYENYEFMDGTSWSCTIWIDDFKLVSQGYMAYPSNFKPFLDKLSILTGGKVFK
jgi:hypothetical protein